MIKVKITVGWHKNKLGTPPYGDNLSIFNFTNTKDNIYNNKKYFVNSNIEKPDYWFILENTKSNKIESVNIEKKNIYFLNSETRYEPSFFLRPSKEKFLKQFNHVYSPNFINSKNVSNVPPFLMWRLRGDPFNDFFEDSDLDFYQNFNPVKDRLLSVYCTTKQITEVQKVRLDFVKKLKEILGDDLHWYGADLKTKTKIEGVGRYKYHLVLENQLQNNFISEKLYDAFLGNSYPIYAGAPNAHEYFNSDSFSEINLNDFNGSIKKITDCLSSNKERKYAHSINESKIQILEKFNIIKRIDEIIENDEPKNKELPSKTYIYPKIHFQNKSFIAKLSFGINRRLKNISQYLEKFYN
jgi:hypothetical protein